MSIMFVIIIKRPNNYMHIDYTPIIYNVFVIVDFNKYV